MATPTFFSDGHTPNRNDSKWMIEQRILGALVDGGMPSSNDIRSADYGGVAPVWTPTGTLGIAKDTVTKQVWFYSAGAWE